MPSVYIVGRDELIREMFIRNAWTVVDDPADADLIQFTGGEDVSPMLYGHAKHPTTGNNPMRDDREANIFNAWVGEKPMTGICRGAQFLNVMSGGTMYQDVDNHAIGGEHEIIDWLTDETIMVTSTHHQMMNPEFGADITATASLSTYKATGKDTEYGDIAFDRDVEVAYYGDTNVLCFQPHPEYVDEDHECQIYYFKLLEHFFDLKA